MKTFTFTKIRSIAKRVLENTPPYVVAPLCSTNTVYVIFTPLKYRKTGSTNSTDEYGSGISFYEYELPSGWTMTSGYIGSGSAPGLVTASNNVSIQPNRFSSGDIKVRAINSLCNTLKSSLWTIIPTNRPVLNLKSNNSENITINCGDNRPFTFTVENGNLATCATFEWDTANKGWLTSTGAAITSPITTTTPTITLIPVSTLSNPPQDVIVKIKNGTEQLTDNVIVNFTNNQPSPLVTGTATWSTNSSSLAKATQDPMDSKKVTVSRNGTSFGILSLTANYTYPACSTNVAVTNSYITVDTPKPSSVSKVPTPEGEIYLTVTFFPGAEYNFYEGGVLTAPNSDNHYLTFVPCNTGKIVQFETVNDCGISAKGQTGVSRTCSSGSALMIFPNPVSDNMNISISETSATSESFSNVTLQKDIKEVQIVNKQGTLIKKLTYSALTKTASLNISELNPDVYTIRVFDGVQWYNEQIIKN